jgi:small subunit ribosomal protein S21
MGYPERWCPGRGSFASFGAPAPSQIQQKGCDRNLKVVVKDPEEFEQALREFRRKVQEQGLVREMRRRAHYVPPAEARKIKSLRARRRRTR